MKKHVAHTIVKYSRLFHVAVLIAGGAFLLLHHTKASAAVQTVVTIEFDDGNADQYQALAMLNPHAMHATFYVNTGFIGDSSHLSWSQLQDLYAGGNEIAHTFTQATCGTGCRGDYSTAVSYDVGSEQQGTIEVFETSAKDGSRINVVDIPVTLSP